MTMAHERSDAEVPAVEVRDLSKVFPINNGLFRRADQLFAVDKVSFQVAPGETLGLVGESGCGKSTTANLMVGLLRPSSGSVLVKGRPVTKANGKTDKWISSQLQMVFQDPFGSLNPRLTAAQNVMEPLRIRNIGKKSERRDRAAQLFQQVGLGTEYLDRYPAAGCVLWRAAPTHFDSQSTGDLTFSDSAR